MKKLRGILHGFLRLVVAGRRVRVRLRRLRRKLDALQAGNIARGIPICGFTGVNGAGKTLMATAAVIADLSTGRPVYSTVPIVSRWGKTIPIVSLRQLLTLHDCTVFFDDVSVIFSSRNTATLPAVIVTLLQVLRHHGVTVLWTAPSWMRCDTLIREVTQGVVNVKPLRPPFWLRRPSPTPWPQPHLVMAGLMDTSTGKADETPTAILRRRIVRPRRLVSWGAYDTLADTPILGRRNRGGRCVDCGGSMEVPKHSPALHESMGLPWYEDDEVLLEVKNVVKMA